jgi:hypothetical protein
VRLVIIGSVGLALAGIPGLVLGLATQTVLLWWRRTRTEEPPLRPILLLLLVELRSGQSALGALQSAAASFPEHHGLGLASRVATIAGLTDSVATADDQIRPALAQLARAQRSGAPLADTIRSLIEADIAAEKTARIARARTLPVRLMVPITLLLLPGLVLLFYAPSILRLFEQLSGPLS